MAITITGKVLTMDFEANTITIIVAPNTFELYAVGAGCATVYIDNACLAGERKPMDFFEHREKGKDND